MPRHIRTPSRIHPIRAAWSAHGALLAAVDRGEEIEITYRGRLRARLVPYRARSEATQARPAHNPLFGLWRDQTDSIDEQIRRIRQPGEFE